MQATNYYGENIAQFSHWHRDKASSYFKSNFKAGVVLELMAMQMIEPESLLSFILPHSLLEFRALMVSTDALGVQLLPFTSDCEGHFRIFPLIRKLQCDYN